MALFVIQNDREYVQLRRRGRFAMEEAEARSPRHRTLAEKAAFTKMRQNMARLGYEYVDDGQVEVRGPLPHLAIMDDDRPDEAHLAAPDPRDLEAQRRWEREEKRRVAQTVPDVKTLVDFRIVATFRKATGRTFRSLVAQGR